MIIINTCTNIVLLFLAKSVIAAHYVLSFSSLIFITYLKDAKGAKSAKSDKDSNEQKTESKAAEPKPNPTPKPTESAASNGNVLVADSSVAVLFVPQFLVMFALLVLGTCCKVLLAKFP